MIRAEFVIRDNKFVSFEVKGHAGLAPAPHDILCAAVSSMTYLVINTATDVFGAKLDLLLDEENAEIRARIESVLPDREEALQGIFRGLLLQLTALTEQYPNHITVRTKQ